MTTLHQIFKKDFARTIETVIKADDREHVYQEVDEYVITKDVSKKLGDFFEAYTETGGTNGVWISGFFGSGKSHLLKILSYVLSNMEFNGTHLGGLFAEKVLDDAKLKADIQNATKKFKSESILFNIDQQAQITSKTNANAILQVFYKVFYDHQGFYGFQPHVAEFESYLHKEGKYEKFKEAFASEYHKPWTDARKDYVDPLIHDAIAEACAKIYNTDAAKYKDYLDTWEDKLKFSIEDFALKVSEYIQSKGPHFRLNFFVDEVGQYIAENTKLMLNLQTIAESLNTKCKGNSWVLVTSQEDLESLVGDDSGIQSDDFSKIQGRFRVRMPLTSANVDEVIEKRLLEKNETGFGELKSLFEKEGENLKTLLSFSEAGLQFKGYQGDKDFVNKYPFIPYQFDLFQQCIKTLSKHNVFQGKHQSVGERSMLGVFQEILKNANFKGTDGMVSFDKMFDGLRATLRGEVQNTIQLAERQLSDQPLAIRVLKVLFLIKYYDSFKATSRNISVLLLDSMNANPVKHHEEVEIALNLLEQQTYIQRKGEVYEFLTDDEKDVEEEIKNTQIDHAQVSNLLNEIIYDGIIKDLKIKYLVNKQEFEYTRKVDGMLFGREKELKIDVVTPNGDNYNNDSYFSGTTMGDSTLMIVRIPEDKRLIADARLALKTDKYIKQSQNSSTKENITRILFEKGQLNKERKRMLENQMNALLAQSTVYIGGRANVSTSSSDGRGRIINAAQELIETAYPKLSMLGTGNLDEAQWKLILAKGQLELFGGDENLLGQAEKEMLNLIERRKNQHDRTSLSDLRDHFSRKPYGWPQMAVWCVVAMLFKRSKIEARDGSNILDDKQFAAALDNNRSWLNTLLTPQIEFDRSQVNLLKQIFQDLFNESNPFTEAKDAALLFRERAKDTLSDINNMLSQKGQYPFVAALEPMAELLGKIIELDYASLISRIKEFEDALLDEKEKVLDPIRQFWSGEQKKIYDRMLLFFNSNNANLDFVDGDEIKVLNEVHESKEPYRGNLIKELKESLDNLSLKLQKRIEEEREKTITEANQNIKFLQVHELFQTLKPGEQDAILQPFTQIISKAKDQKFISNLQIERQKLGQLLTDQLNELGKLAAKAQGKGEDKKELFINLRNVEKHVHLDKKQLQNEADVMEYIEALKAAMLEQIKENRKITLM